MRLEKKRLYENFMQFEEGKNKNRKETAFHRLKRKHTRKKKRASRQTQVRGYTVQVRKKKKEKALTTGSAEH